MTCVQTTVPDKGYANIDSHLRHLDLSECDLSELQMTTVARQLLRMSVMKYLNISNNMLSDNAAIDIGYAISNNPLLENINLSSCDLSHSQITKYCYSIKQFIKTKTP